MSQAFDLHPQLRCDCHLLGRFEACTVLLHRNASLPWFILVPETLEQDLLELDTQIRTLAMEECARVSAYLKLNIGCPKVNFAAIGNLVPQLHLHVVGRTPGDVCWPAPVWGHLETKASYQPAAVEAMSQTLEKDFGLHRAQCLF